MQVRRMRGEETGQICEVERVHARRMRGEETGQICDVERGHVRRMRGRRQAKYVRWRGCM